MAALRSGTALVAVILAAVAVQPAAAQGGQGRLDVTFGTTAITFTTPGVIDFDTGWIDHSGVLVSVLSRPPQTAWELRIRADDVSMGGYGKPVDDLLWRPSTSAVWTPLATTDQVVAQGQGDLDITIHFRTRLDWGVDLPGDYATGVTLTVVRP